MSRVSLYCLVALSLTTSLTSVASARRLVLPPDDAAPADPVPTFSQPPGTATTGTPDTGQAAPRPSPPRPRPLPAPARADVRAALSRLRAQNLAAFRAYYKGRVYPSNLYSSTTLNVWRDEANHYCAAATIMVKSGNEALAVKLATDDNFIKLADVKHGEVMNWITMSGFTQDELVLIQRPFRPVAHSLPAEPTAPEHVAVSPRLRTAETARLLAMYKKIDAQLVAKAKLNIELATNRLMANPTLAWQLVTATGG